MIAGAEVLDWSRQVDEVSLPLVGVVAPWQATFIAVGLPGIVIVMLLALIREPRRKGRIDDGEVPAWPDQKLRLVLGTYIDEVRFSAEAGWQIYDMTLAHTSAEHRQLGELT